MYSITISKSTLLPDVLDQTQIHLLYSQINNNATYNIIICTHSYRLSGNMLFFGDAVHETILPVTQGHRRDGGTGGG